jgi:threonine aldolase
MKAHRKPSSRRDFFKTGGLSALPLLIPPLALGALPNGDRQKAGKVQSPPPLNFIFDGPFFSPREYLNKLNEMDSSSPIAPDFYSSGGCTSALEEEFARITGKEKAIYLPSGTMANQLAMKLLNGNNTKAIVPENSHIFRDEADAAQSIHRIRLVPLGKDKAWFDLQELEDSIRYMDQNEVFKSGLGTVVIENPVRRADGAIVPIEHMMEIRDYCKGKGIRLHLDGARLHIASAYSNVSVREYSSLFDTVYISLYKYLNAAGGGILCGEAELIDQVPHLIKVHGGNVLQSWPNTAMALHYLRGVEERWKEIFHAASYLIPKLNELEGVQITEIKNGSNVYDFRLAEDLNLEEFTNYLQQEHDISFRPPNEQGIIKLKVYETLLIREADEVLRAWKAGLDRARV